jgi:hypothetical protein
LLAIRSAYYVIGMKFGRRRHVLRDPRRDQYMALHDRLFSAPRADDRKAWAKILRRLTS